MSVKKAVMVLSGGLDSTTLLYKLVDEGYEVYPISFFYGQNHSKELEFAKKTCEKLGLKHKLVDISFLKDILKSSLLNGADAIPEGHYQAENMKATVVPNRNMIFTAIAVGYADSIGAKTVALGVHTGDHYIYPDCRPEFIKALQDAVNTATSNDPIISFERLRGFIEGEGCFSRACDTRKDGSKNRYPSFAITQKDEKVLQIIRDQIFMGEGSIYVDKGGVHNFSIQRHRCSAIYKLMKGNFRSKEKEKSFLKREKQFKDNYLNNDKAYEEYNHIKIYTPYLTGFDKGDIIKEGINLGVDYSLTRTCYKGLDRPCGVCGSCVERNEAFKKNGIIDPLLSFTNPII